MYPEVNAARARAGMTMREVAEKMGCTVGTLCLKLNGKSPITLPEALRLKQILKSDLPVEMLFKEKSA